MDILKISKRLRCAAAFARQGDVIADVGTDHAYLPIYLYKQGIIRSAIATDINAGPIERARKNIIAYSCEEAIVTRISDGLLAAEEYSPDTVFILGMGGELIVRIISDAEWLKEKKARLVLQPMTHRELLREYLFKNGFSITDEALVEDGKIYQIIVAEYTGEIYCAEALELFFGKINLLRRDNLLLLSLMREREILGARIEGKRSAGIEDGEDFALLEKIEEYLNADGTAQYTEGDFKAK